MKNFKNELVKTFWYTYKLKIDEIYDNSPDSYEGHMWENLKKSEAITIFRRYERAQKKLQHQYEGLLEDNNICETQFGDAIQKTHNIESLYLLPYEKKIEIFEKWKNQNFEFSYFD